MIEFNPDGSVKLPGIIAEQKARNSIRMLNHRCITIAREVVNFTAPKKCVLNITLSENFPDSRFIQTIYDYFSEKASVPHKLIKMTDKHFRVEIGTDFRRCSDCQSLINRYRDFLDGNIIEAKGSCTFEGRKKNFGYEDYFD